MQASNHRIGLVLSALASGMLPSIVQAAEIKVSGTVTYVTVSQEPSDVPGDRSILYSHDKGIIQTGDATSPINGAAGDCFDTIVLGADGNVAEGAGYCDAFDKDGDAYWWTWTGTEPGSTWTVYMVQENSKE
jgi:hypothetical protein